MSEANRISLRRWSQVAFRSLHLVFMIGLGAALLGAPFDSRGPLIGLVASGAAMLALDLWAKPHLFREASGGALIVKLGALVWMALDADARQPLFWAIVVWSSLFSHAPAGFRHIAWLGRKSD